MVSVRADDGVLHIAEGGEEASAKAMGERCFLGQFDLGSVEFEDTSVSDLKVLVRGKATRHYRVDELAYRERKVVRYLVEVPVSEPGVQVTRADGTR